MNILFLDQFTELGGAQQVLLDTLDAVQERGWQAHVLIPGNGPLQDEIRSRRIPVSKIRCQHYRSGQKSLADNMRFPFDVWGQTQAIQKLTKSGAFDLIYVNGPRVLPAASLANHGRAHVLFHAHSHVRQKSAAWLAGRSMRLAAASIVGCSRSVLEPLRPFSSELRVIPNGVRDMGFVQREFGRDGHWRVGLIGRIAPEKGQTEFLRAASLLRGYLPGAEFLICGAPLFGASDRYSSEVRAIAQELPVTFLEWQPDVSHVLHTLDLLALPSKEEGMGRAALEAFSAGVPVVAFPTGGIPEIIVDGETGFLTGDASPEALVETILQVTAKRDLLQQVACAARLAYQRCYTVASYQERITGLLENLVSARASACETEALPERR